ncbi:TIGR03885 family FMN-dependent LLM class oxidoreductase [Cereibacter sp. SYSU M97828]|nr:TIGR03885 family FMN-dependent LLM class oxidoreductase [Cereibacter flavus]
MAIIGFHASHEQIDPKQLLADVKLAEEAGFAAAMCSDHFVPWSERQGQSGFAWSWLGAALEATSLSFGVVNAPGQRYHPAIIAQAAATLAQMYPGRFWAALGSGEAANEHITGDRWPEKARRNERLGECVNVMRKLFAGQEVSHDGLIRVDRAQLWTRPETPPALLAAAVSAKTAAWAAEWADGLITVNQDHETLRRVLDAYRSAGGKGPVCLQVHVSYAASEAEALAIAHDQWRSNVAGPPLSWDIDSVEGFDCAARTVRPEDMHAAVRISADPAQITGWLCEYLELGFERLYLHHVGKEQRTFIETFGCRVLPELM